MPQSVKRKQHGIYYTPPELTSRIVQYTVEELIVERFAALPMISPNRQDHIAAADLRNRCRRGGVQLGTIDALFAELCIRHDMEMLSTDRDFVLAAAHCPLRVWTDGS